MYEDNNSTYSYSSSQNGTDYNNVNSYEYSSSQNSNKQNKTERFKKTAAIVMASILVVIAISGVVVGVSDYLKSNNKDNESLWAFGNSNSNYKIESTSVTDGNIEVVTDVSDIAQKVMPAVVSITEKSTVTGYYFGQSYSDEVSGSGSGIIIGENEDELQIVTNNHVVSGAETIEVTFNNDKVVSAVIKGTEPEEDLAILSVKRSDVDEETYNSIAIAQMGDSNSVRVGDAVVAIGNALGYGQSVTFGYISAKNREIEVENTSGSITKMTVFQTDAAINPGNSGGALVNMNGEVIGINSAKLSSEEVEGMGYSIPVSNISGVIDDLSSKEILADDDKGFLGIRGGDITEEQSEMLGYPKGIFVKELIEGGGAKESGIKAGDIITKINGEEVTTISALSAEVSSLKKGTVVNITVMRANDGVYKEQEIKVTLTQKIAVDPTATPSPAEDFR